MKVYLSAFCSIMSLACLSQDCKNYFYLQNNKTIEMTMYDKKGEVSGKQLYMVSNYQATAEGSTANLNSEIFDRNGKSTAKSSNSIKCSNGIMMMDMKMSMPQAQSAQVGNTDVKADNVYLEYPSSINVGDKLKDGHMEMNIENKGMQQTITMDITDRKAEEKEKITTTAGSWDCYKITNHTKMKIKTMGIGIPMNMDVTEWFAPGFGVVKTKTKYGETAITAIK